MKILNDIGCNLIELKFNSTIGLKFDSIQLNSIEEKQDANCEKTH